MYYKEMNSISFKASVQILYIVLCNYCTTCIIYRDKIKFKLMTGRLVTIRTLFEGKTLLSRFLPIKTLGHFTVYFLRTTVMPTVYCDLREGHKPAILSRQ